MAKTEFIKTVKEEKYQDGFLHDIFEECLGYTLDNTNPNNFNLEREKKNETDGKKADGVIHLDGKIVGIIELKDQKSKNLDAIEAQAFNYHNSHSSSEYIIISNFDELRFYIDKKTAYEKFNLFYLTYEEFKKLHLLLSYESIKEGLPLKLKEKSANFELQISKELYRDFSIFRNHLFENIVKNNFVIASETPAVVIASEAPAVVIASEAPAVVIASEARQSLNKSTFLRLTQKLCDRIIFILFAEDRGLLRHNTIKEIREEFKGQKFTSYALYDIYKFYFNAINEGNEKLGIPKYNGGLFAKDELLDVLVIDDIALDMEAQKLSDYDFVSDISVNILGHIFEQSLTDLEEMEKSFGSEALASQEGGVNTQGANTTPLPKSVSKRKKDGVFYTPEYITRYIVQNTLGRLCEEKKKELNILEALPAIETSFVIARSEATKQSSTKKRLPRTEVLAMTQYKENILDYREWLTNLKILDPACGSGAFLNQALEFLIKEHTLVRDMLLPFEDLTLGYEIEKEILEHNLYGVDINEDAVEIAKLSLWLRTAHRGRELTSLANKIKCGNSLIDDKSVAKNAFVWEEEFAEVFAKGGFDVVIGNPPYVSSKKLNKENKEYFGNKYISATSQYDLYTLFIELGILVTKTDGCFSYIIPDKFLITDYGKSIRELLIKNTKMVGFKDLSNENIFEDASVYPVIIVLEKILEHNVLLDESVDLLDYFGFSESDIVVKKVDSINEIVTLDVWRPIATSKNIIIGGEENIIVSNGDINRYYISENKKGYLDKFREKDVCKDKLLIKKLCFNLEACIDEVGYMPVNTTYCIKSSTSNLKYILCCLNSSLLSKYARSKYKQTALQGGYIELRVNQVQKLPIKKISEEAEHPFIEKADKMLSLNKQFQETKQNFTNELGLEKLTKKLQNFEELEFEEFVSEYAKAKKLKFADKLQERNFKQEWQAIFENDKILTCRLKDEIAKTDKEIDEMVYKLYDLSEDEVRIVEGV